MKTLKALIGILIGALLLPAVAAAAPAYINYQGRLIDSNGNPLTGTYSVAFTIYDAASGGNTLWSETQSVTPDNGIFNVKLGASTPLTPDVFSADNRYLGVKVGTDAEMSPRTQLLSVPYAIYADSAASVGVAGQGVVISTYVAVSGYVSAAKFYGDGSSLSGITATNVTAAGVQAGALGSGVITSSIAINGVYTDAIQNSAVTDAKIASGITASKLTGALPAIDGSALTGITATNVTAAGVQAGALGSGVIASSIAINGVYTGAIQNSAVTDAKIAGMSASKLSGTLLSAQLTGNYLNDVKVSSAIYADNAASAGSVTNGVYTNVANTITGSLTMSGANADIISGSSITTSGTFYGNGSGLTGMSASQVGLGNVTNVAQLPLTGGTMTGALGLTGAASYITAQSSITTSGTFYGNGSGLTNVTATDNSKVLKAGDTMTGALTMSGANADIISGSSITTSGSFYGDGSSLTGVIQSSATGTYALNTTGNAGSVTNGVYTNAANTMTGSLTMSGANADIISGSSITTSGSFYGDGSNLTGVIQSSATGTYALNTTGNAATATNAAAVTNGVYTNVANTITGSLTMSGAGADIVSGSSITTTGSMLANDATFTNSVSAGKVVVADATTSRFHLPVLTQNQIEALYPAAAGDLYFDSNAVAVCVSTGTTQYAIAYASDTAKGCGQP